MDNNALQSQLDENFSDVINGDISSGEDSDYYSESKCESKSSKRIESDKECSTSKSKSKRKILVTGLHVKNSKSKKNCSNEDNSIDSNDDLWKWWEEEPHPKGVKWFSLQHEGPLFPPDYSPLPENIQFYYDRSPMKLNINSEEIATFYAKMLDHEYVQKPIFNKNFFEDWKASMTKLESNIITDLAKCNFREIAEHFKALSEERKCRTKEEKEKIKLENSIIQDRYGYCTFDGHRQKVGNYRIEPPGLFRGRGEHPKQGKLKYRVQPEDIIINIGKDSKIPTPPSGHCWNKVQHDQTVTWLACWIENITGNYKYIMLNPTSRLKGEKDWQKYELARKLKKHVAHIRENYFSGLKSREMFVRQRSVALYLIDRLALRAGNEKDSDEEADTVGCCSLRVEHIKLHDEIDELTNVVEFDFLGKDSIRYQNQISIDKQVYKNLKIFIKNKSPSDDLFDRLTTGILNKYLHELMEGLTAKVFRTYNASSTLQEQLEILKTTNYSTIPELLLVYNRANRAVAVLCNHQRAIPKSFEKQMDNIQKKITEKEEEINSLRKEYKAHKKDLKKSKDIEKNDRLKKMNDKLNKLEQQLHKLKIQATDKDENKQISLGTSKLNYLDPRITVAWSKSYSVPIEKLYNKTQREKFAWALHMADQTFRF